MKTTRGVVVTLAIVSATLSGCAQDPTHVIGAPVLDSQFGEAFRKARAMQVVYPDGVEKNDEGYSGKAAHSAMQRLESGSNNGASAPMPARAPAPPAGQDSAGNPSK